MTIHEITTLKTKKTESQEKATEEIVERLERMIKRVKDQGDFKDMVLMFTHGDLPEGGVDIFYGDESGATLNTVVDITKGYVLDYFQYGYKPEDDEAEDE